MRNKILAFILCLALMAGHLIGLDCAAISIDDIEDTFIQKVTYLDGSDLHYDLMETATTFVVAQHKALGASHYAYTEALYEESAREAATGVGTEIQFHPGSRLVLVTLTAEGDKVKKTET
jgi:hypothetical protein